MTVAVTVDCGTGQVQSRPLTPAEQTDQQNAVNSGITAAQAAAQVTANTATIQQKLVTVLANNQTWLANNPTGAVLTAVQTRALVQELNGIIRLLLGLLLDVTQLQSTAGT